MASAQEILGSGVQNYNLYTRLCTRNMHVIFFFKKNII